MSLVGSLEDLGLGDILQMVSLSRKSGLLLLRSTEGDGRIVLESGLVRAAHIEGGPSPIRAAPGANIEPSTLREQVECAVMHMFAWRTGEFSFEFTDEVSRFDPESHLSAGLNPQYLAIEATRRGDEERRRNRQESRGGVFPESAAAASRGLELDEALPDPEARSTSSGYASDRELPPLVVMDPNLRTLEWIKSELASVFPRVHIFQNGECGVARIRQYLGRGQVPAVLVSNRLSGVSSAESQNPGEMVRRLRNQAPQMAILVMEDAGSENAPLPAADAVVQCPPLCAIAGAHREGDTRVLAQNLRSALVHWSGVRRAACS